MCIEGWSNLKTLYCFKTLVIFDVRGRRYMQHELQRRSLINILLRRTTLLLHYSVPGIEQNQGKPICSCILRIEEVVTAVEQSRLTSYAESNVRPPNMNDQRELFETAPVKHSGRTQECLPQI